MNDLHPFAPLFRKLVLLTAVCGTVGCLFLCLTYFIAFDSDIQHFVYASPVLIAAEAAFLAGLGLVLANAFLGRKKVSLTAELPVGLGEIFFGFFAAALYAICFLREVGDMVQLREPTLLEQVAACAAVLPALYFLAASLSRKNPVLCAVLAFGGAGAVIASMFRQYFDLSLPLNGSVRIIASITSSALLLLFLSEARLQIAPEKSTAGFFILANGCAGLFLTGVGIAQAVFSGMDPERTFDLLPQIAMTAAGGLAFCRMCRAYRCFGPYVPPAEEEKQGKKEVCARE